jgi:hypothetical protein
MPDKGRGFVRRVTAETLQLFAPLLRTGTTLGAAEPDGEVVRPCVSEDNPALSAALGMFEGESICAAPPRRRGLALSDLVGKSAGVNVHPVGNVVWRKVLVASDVQRQAGNPTGGLRLTQARFRTADGAVIDQTSYFRESIFGAFIWSVGRENPYREDAWGLFRLIIRGDDWGVHRLRLTHKPSGEAGQHNYTTNLHWGDLGARIRDAALAGARLVLHAPAADAEPFLITID